MNNYLCMLNGVVANVIYCDEATMQTTIGYDSFIDLSTVQPQVWVGWTLNNDGTWTPPAGD